MPATSYRFTVKDEDGEERVLTVGDEYMSHDLGRTWIKVTILDRAQRTLADWLGCPPRPNARISSIDYKNRVVTFDRVVPR